MTLVPFVGLLFLFSFIETRVVVVDKDVEGYYWRDFTEVLPKDAIPAGIDANGNPTYIGQVLHISPPNGKLIPGPIHVDGKMYYAWGENHYIVSKNVKILCSQYPQYFKWVKTDIEDAKKLTHTSLVKGGYDTSYELYIGRIQVDNEVVVGKVTLTEPYDAIGYPFNGKPYFVKSPFEILHFDPSSDDESSSDGNIVNVNIYVM